MFNSSTNKVYSPISSAVILPVETEASNSPRAKRRQSSTSDTASKRPRLSHDGGGKSPSALRASPQATEPTRDESSARQGSEEKVKDLNQERRKSSVQEERKRGQRLFGGLLSTLSQRTPNGQQKRRLEIEKRQAEKAKQQKVDDEVRRAEKLASLKKIRQGEQVKFDKESVSSFGVEQVLSGGLLTSGIYRCAYDIPICWLWQTFYAQRRNLSWYVSVSFLQPSFILIFF